MQNFTTNLNQLARVGGIDRLIGREKSWSALFRFSAVAVKTTRCRRESGVGKPRLQKVLPGELFRVMCRK
ncbi:hypothetical protein ACVXHB_13395 [Escherichia coli]